jgi:hypothetical protein
VERVARGAEGYSRPVGRGEASSALSIAVSFSWLFKICLRSAASSRSLGVSGQSNGLDPRIDKERDLGFDDVPVRESWPELEPLLSSFGSSMFGGDWSSKRAGR